MSTSPTTTQFDHRLTDQEAFDIVAKHLLTQREKSQYTEQDEENDSETVCAYRNPNGLRCAVGALIPDELYDPEMEGESIPYILEDYELPHLYGVQLFLLNKLQNIHDALPPEDWRQALFEAAINFGLDPTVIQEN